MRKFELEANIVAELDEAGFAGLEIDVQYNMNHNACSAGTDTKKRLYVKRINAGVLYKCHHCGDQGFFHTAEPIRSYDELLADEGKVELMYDSTRYNKMIYWKDGANTFDLWPVEVKLWWLSCGFTEQVAADYDACYNRDVSMLFLPTTKGILQARSFSEKYPKYMTAIDKGTPKRVIFKTATSNKVVITEDIASALRCHLLGVTSIALLGTSMDEALLTYTKSCSKRNILVWLDMDSAGVIGTSKLCRELDTYHTVRDIFQPEPKSMTDEQIKEILGL